MISIIVVSAGVELWNEYTIPALEGLRKHAEGDYELVTVDVAGLGRGDINTPRLIPYAQAVNLAARVTSGRRLLILNNDIVVSGPYLHLLGKNLIEGPKHLLVEGDAWYIEGWCLSVDRALWNLLGGFDEGYVNSWDDVDFSWRATKLGLPLGKVENFPISHYWGRTRPHFEGANRRDNDNMLRFQGKKRGWEESGLKDAIGRA